MAKKRLTRTQMEAKIMAYDMCAILDDAGRGDLSYLSSWLSGDGIRQYSRMNDADILKEWVDGGYAGQAKHEIVTRSLAYSQHEYIRQLWDTGDPSAMWDGAGVFYGAKSRKMKSMFLIGKKK